MVKYLKENIKRFVFSFVIVLSLGPLFSFVLSKVYKYLDVSMGDWLGFYGAVFGMVISVWIVHFQIYKEKQRELLGYRPELILNYDYQLIKSNCRVYFDDKHWFYLMKSHKKTKFVTANDFENNYSKVQKRDKIFSIEIVNVQPIFNIHIVFGENKSSEIIPKLDVDQRIYVVSKEHQEEIKKHLHDEEAKFLHVPDKVAIYFTTLAGEVNCYIYEIDNKGYCVLVKKSYGVSYPNRLKTYRLCDYFLSK